MPRAPRIWFPGAVYHLVQRGNNQKDIFKEDRDREWLLKTVKETKKEMEFKLYLYSLMDNHYHLIIETPEPNLSSGMRQINGVYTQAYNRRHNKTGHIFQGRYKALLVDIDEYAQELSRYIHLNPVKAGMVEKPHQYKWSSYRDYINVGSDPLMVDKQYLFLYHNHPGGGGYDGKERPKAHI